MTAEPAPTPLGRRPTLPTPPRHLASDGRRLWRAIVGAFALEAHHEAILVAACESLDRQREAQRAIASDGLMVEGRFGPRLHPAAALERYSRLAMLRALRELGLDYEAIGASARTVAARDARWRP